MLINRWSSRRKAPISSPPRPPPFRPVRERLDHHHVHSHLLVTTTADKGENNNPPPDSLRAAIIQSNRDGGGDQIYFDIGQGTQTIKLQTELPRITAPVTINGYKQAGTTSQNGATPNDQPLNK